MKKIAPWIFNIGFFAVCAFFSVGMLIPEISGAAKDSEGSVPQLVMNNGSEGGISLNRDFGDEFEEYFSKHFACRNELVDAFSDIKAGLFQTGNSQVIVGKDDFLFFEETVGQFVGNDLIDAETISKIADSIENLYRYSISKGADFLFVCAPNKNTVYPEFMPDNYVRYEGKGDMDNLYAELERRGVPYLDLRPILREASKNFLIYHKRDTHWNGLGALYGYNAMMSTLGRTPLDFSELGPYEISDFEGDLDSLLYTSRDRFDDNMLYDLSEQYIYTSAFVSEMDMRITTKSGGNGKLLMFRDSFANALIGYLACDFSSCVFEKAMPYSVGQLEKLGADCVIVEIAERNIKTLLGCDKNIPKN